MSPHRLASLRRLVAWSLLLALGVVSETRACRSGWAGDPSDPLGRTSLSQQSRLEIWTLRALEAEDERVRGDALSVLAQSGGPRHVEAMAARLEDSSFTVRRQAFAALGALGCEEAIPAVVPYLRSGDHRADAARCLGRIGRKLEAEDVATLLDDLDGWVRAEAAVALAAILGRSETLSAEEHRSWSLRLARLLQEDRGAGYDTVLSNAFGLLAADQVGVLLPWTEVDDPAVSFRARAWLAIHGASTAWSEDAAQLQFERRARLGRARGRQALRESKWREITMKELTARVAGARLLLFGEAHAQVGEGPLRDAQIRLFEAWARGGGQCALGFEPSVAHVQEPVLDAARAVEVSALPLEEEWQPWMARRLTFAGRDQQAYDRISEHLEAGGDRRMFVIRGQTHVGPGSWLPRALADHHGLEPCRVLGFAFPPLDALGDDPAILGRCFEIGESGQWFACCCEDLGREVRRWSAE